MSPFGTFVVWNALIRAAKGMEKVSDLLTMSNRELTRVEVMQRLKEKTLSQKEAARMLGVGVRQVKRLLHRFRAGGAAALISRARGRPSNRRLTPALTEQVLEQLRSRYPDFGPTLAQEKLSEGHHLHLSVESVRQLMIAEGLWHPRRAKKAVVHQMRERRPRLGELVQIDGSPHDWFEGRAPACTLLAFIDDASGQVMTLRFAPAETTFSYFAATRDYLTRHGKPLTFYSDKHSIFRVNAPTALSGHGLTQFGRAMTELGIEILCANTPQAKGRVERLYQTLQDRLVKELRLRGVSGIDPGNAFLPEFLTDFNPVPEGCLSSSAARHRPLRFPSGAGAGLRRQPGPDHPGVQRPDAGLHRPSPARTAGRSDAQQTGRGRRAKGKGGTPAACPRAQSPLAEV